MIEPDELLASWSATLANVPALVAALSNGADSLIVYGGVSTQSAIYQMEPGSILIAWNGMAAARSMGSLKLRHEFSLYLREGEKGDYGRLCYLLLEGMPDGGAVKLLHTAIHPGCYPMDLDLPRATRRTIQVAADTVEYFEFQAWLTEIED